jgi:xanthine/uracil permease
MVASREETVSPSPIGHTQRTVGGLFGDLARESSRLIRQEIALAKAEVAGRVGQMGTGAAELAVGGALLFAGFLALMAAAIIGITYALPAWLATLIIGVFVCFIGLILALKGRRDIGPGKLVPHRTLRTLREDADWAKEQMR